MPGRLRSPEATSNKQTVEDNLLGESMTDVHALVSSGAVNAYAAIEVVRKHGEKAGAVLQDLINGNEGKAKKVVTRSDVNEWIPPRKISHYSWQNTRYTSNLIGKRCISNTLVFDAALDSS